MNFGTVKSVRDERVFGVGDNFMFLMPLGERGECANARERQKDAGKDDAQAD